MSSLIAVKTIFLSYLLTDENLLINFDKSNLGFQFIVHSIHPNYLIKKNLIHYVAKEKCS